MQSREIAKGLQKRSPPGAVIVMARNFPKEVSMNSIRRRLFLKRGVAGAMGCIALGACALLTAGASRAQDYPTRTVTIVVPFPAGISLDGIARKVGERLAERVGQPVIVENRPGGGSIVGTSAVAKAAPDGYTLLMGGSGNLAINATLQKTLPYDPGRDFVPIALTSYAQFVLVVNPALPVHSVQDLVKLAKEKPGQLSYASPGPGTPHYLAAEMLKEATGIDLVHVAYKGSPPALTDLIGGHIHLMFVDVPPALPLIKAGKVRALGVTSRSRIEQAPDIPPVAEAGVPGFEVVAWNMLVAPSKTPPDIVSRLHAEVKAILALSDTRDWMLNNGLTPAADTRSPEELSGFVKSEIVQWGKVLERIGIARSM
jgi:tripartite-type tricarboxylate transporter receptor subunit TctC